jgi:hypothetical protein
LTAKKPSFLAVSRLVTGIGLGYIYILVNSLKMCSFGSAVIGKPTLDEPRKLQNFHVNPDIKNFESKLSKWYLDYGLVIFTT